MEQNLESKLNFKQKLISLHNHHKLKLYTVIIIVILAMSSSVFFKFHNEKKNSLISIILFLIYTNKETFTTQVVNTDDNIYEIYELLSNNALLQ